MLEILVGLQVTDNDSYTKYRQGMTPILESMGGSFGYDFMVDQTLISESEEGKRINRVFTIRFPDKAVMDQFFSHPEYLKIKEEHFAPAVSLTELIATYTKG